MARLILIGLAMIIIAGCQPKVKTVIQKEYVPVPSVPLPPETNRPVLRTEVLTDEEKQNKGEVAKAYKISIKQLQQYSSILEQIVGEYRRLSIQSQKDLDLLEKFSQPQETPAGPFSSANPEGEVTFTEVQVEPAFDFQHEYEKWATEKKLQEMGDQMKELDQSNYLNIDEDK